MYGAWRLLQEVCRTVKAHDKEGMDMPVLDDPLEAVRIEDLSKFARDVDVGGRPEDWLP